jgi:ferric-dicitrate binding protein FerR (iron transport regulator)
VIGRRGPAGDDAQSEELERLCDRLGRVEAPFDEITRSRAEAGLAAELAREPARRYRRTLAWTVALVAVGAAAAGAFVARTVVPAAASRIARSPERLLRFEPYVVAATGQVGSVVGPAAASSTVPEALVQPTSRLDVPAGWLVRASLGDAIAITLTGPARAWSEGADGRTVVHLDQGRLLASLESGAGRRLQIVSPGAVTDVVGTLFSVEVVGGASRVAVAHGRVQVSAAAEGSSGGQLRAAREIAAGQGWLTALPEPDALEPALAGALADHERTPPPRGASVPLSVTDAPSGAGVWVGKRRIASAPAWVLVEPHAAVRLSALAPAAARPVPASSPPPSTEPTLAPSTEPTLAPSSKPSPRVLEPAARATTPAGPRALLTRPGAEPTEPPPADAAFASPEGLTARTLFREADAARAKGDTALALRTLRALVERFPRESAAAAAHYELALMEEAAGSGDAALRDLAAVDTPSLEEPTEYLRCRVLAKRTAVRTTEAERCLADFRRRFPASAHDADALATETAMALARGGCPAAQALLTELERRHPEHGSAARLRAACGRRP